ncbi:hypothetical protein FDV58_18320 [Bradyrhizobium elkanii]|uniref:Uncharacterized protein n=1 Tax=Bradyrhizobium elkanii TaxID=29448 RepID=A0A4U6S2E2_BRAEL|nr:hypothetical protein FDV58_18320 [Bradyrhizobium elkanii]
MTSRIHHVVAAFGSTGTFSRPDRRTIGIQDANAPKDDGLAEDQVRIIAAGGLIGLEGVSHKDRGQG